MQVSELRRESEVSRHHSTEEVMETWQGDGLNLLEQGSVIWSTRSKEKKRNSRAEK